MELKQNIVNLQGEVVGSIDLDNEIFGQAISDDILHRIICWQLSKRRAGTHKTKGISEISGTTKKPYAQKGTGRARQGSLRSAQFRGGAVIFGPVVRSHEYNLTKKFRKLGLKIALSSKLANGQLKIIDNVNIEDNKTKNLRAAFDKLSIKSVLVIDGEQANENFKKACGNIYKIDILPQIGANVYDILNHDELMITRNGLELLQARLK